ncbi:hypothetical protein [Aporhodopirellula aestuarii]|uniref:CBS domain-containing protein n=1 Tax=Aporhodopirellula aestuarii TaxID=2950107 RepID=A0ABT0U6L6_9BACT|nr:hypothetical protein [Aporhodopirellula aestuarii]MCM2372540.1 hypothetical protein [Aporhodopirellula aestuarii]
MPLHSSDVHSLRRVFMQAFAVHDITEPLVSFDDFASTEKVREIMDAGHWEVVGIRRNGKVQGYVELDELGDGICGDFMKPFDESIIVPSTAPLAELVLRLRDQRRMFVSILGCVGGFVSRSDLDKPPVRMWLFGMVTLIEMRFRRLIERHCTDESWKAFLSASRIRKAEQLLQERDRRNQSVALLDCLQLSDKAQIVARNKMLRERTRFESRREVEQTAKMLEKLRNNLAHCQTITTGDWDAIVILSENLDGVLDGPPDAKDEAPNIPSA